METRMASEQQRIEAEREAERLRMEARMEAMMLYVQTLGAAVGRPPPPTLFAAPPPPHVATPVSMDVLMHMFMLRVKPEHYLKPSYMFILSNSCNYYSCNIDGICLSCLSHMQSVLLCAESIGGI
jgi:hypothetical protein